MSNLVTTIQPTKASVRRGSSGHYYNALPNQATALSYAQMFDIIISNPTKYQTFADAMLGASGNPKLILGSYDKSIQSDASVNFPEYMYTHSSTTLSAANRIPVGFSSKYTQMQADHTGAVYTDARGFTATSWKEWVSRDHWHNLTTFNAGTVNKPLSTIYFDSMDEDDGNIISWQDGHAYTAAEFRAITWTIGDFAKSIRPAAGLWLGGNGLKSGSFYMGGSTNPSAPTGNSANFPSHLDWALAEDFVRGNFDSATAWPNDTSLQQDINMVKSAAIKQVMFWCVVNLQNFAASPGHAGISFTSAQVDQWHRYTIAAYLIGNDGYAVYEFAENTNTVQGWQDTHPYYSVTLGLPIDNKANAAAYINATTGLYTRNFENGTVYINNTGAGVTFNPGTGYSQVGGGAIAGNVTLGAHDGLVLLHTATPIGGGGGGGSTASKKPAMQGMIDRDGNSIPASYITHMGGMAYHVNWANLQAVNDGTLNGSGVAGIATLIANARSYGVGAKIRIFCGSSSPGWLKTLVGTWLYADGQDDGLGTTPQTYNTQTVPKFWLPAYISAFDTLMKLMAAAYDTTDVVLDIAIANTMTKYAEPMQRFFNVSQNRAELVGGGATFSGANVTVAASAGYSDAANIAAFKAGIDSAFTWWKNANISVAWTPYQSLYSQAEAGITYAGDNQIFDTNDDATLSKTKNLIDYCVAKFGDRFVKENNSIRESTFTYDSAGRATGIAAPTGSYGMMYTYLLGLGPPSFYQTASTGPDNTNPRIGSLDKTCDGAVNILKANAVEPPGDYTGRANDGQSDSSMYGPVNFDKWNSLLYGNPLPAIGGGGGGGGGGGTQDVVVSTDTYTRTVTGGLGTSDSGKTYITSGPATDYSVDAVQGRAVINIPLASSRRAMLAGVSQQDFHVVGKFSMNELPAGDNNDLYLFARATSDGQNGYRLQIDISPTTGQITAKLQKIVAGAATSLGVTITDPNPFAINTTYTAEIVVTGVNPTTLQFMLYRDSDGRPSAYTDPITDTEASLQGSTYTAGWSWFIRSLSTSAPATGYVTEFDVFTPVPVTVNAAPILSNPSPADGASLQIVTGNVINQKFTIQATDTDGIITGVQIQIGATAAPMVLAAGTWSYTKSLAAGTYAVSYTATDDLGASTTLSTNITVLPIGGPPPPPGYTPTPTTHIYDRAAGGTVSSKIQALITAAAADLTYTPAVENFVLPDGNTYRLGPNATQGVCRIEKDPASPDCQGTNAITLDAAVNFANNVRFEIDSGVCILDGTGNTQGMFTTTGFSNWSLTRGNPGFNNGYFRIDCSLQPTNLKSRLTHLQNSDHWLIEWIESIQTLYTVSTATAMIPFHSTQVPGTTATSPRNFIYRHHKNLNSGAGWGPNQITSALNGYIADISSVGGIVLRLETDGANASGVHNVLAAGPFFGENGNRVVNLTPHAVNSDGVIVRGVYGISMFGGAFIGGNSEGGSFTNSSVVGGCIVAGSTAQDPQNPPALLNSSAVVEDNHSVGVVSASQIGRNGGFTSANPGGDLTVACNTSIARAEGITTTPSAPVIGGPVDVIDVVPKAEFAVIHQRHDGTNLGEVQGTDLRFGRYVMQPGFISYDLHRSHPMAALGTSEPNKIDFSLTRAGVELMSGEIVERDADTDTDMISISGNDWMNYLDSLYLDFDPNNLKAGDNYTKTDTDLKTITEGLIQKVLNGYDHTIDLAMNNDPTGLIQSQHFIASDLNSLKSMIDTLANQNPGFEWEITHDQEFIMYSPKRLDQSSYRVDESNIKQVHFGEQGVQATTVYGRGQGAGSAQAIAKSTAPGVASQYRDRVMVVDLGTVSTRKSLASLTNKQLTDLAKQKLEFWITIIPRPNENVYGAVSPGQYVYVDWNDGYLNIQGWFRCAGYEAYVNTAGDEQITFNFNTDSAEV